MRSSAGKQCAYKKDDRTRCRMHGSADCFFQNPDSAAECEVARRAGGIKLSRKVAVLPAEPAANRYPQVGLALLFALPNVNVHKSRRRKRAIHGYRIHGAE